MILHTIISETVDNTNLDQATFSEIISVFNVTVDNPFAPNIMEAFREKFKAKLLDIFQSQGRNYENYLTLPKFQTLKHTTRQKLYFLFNQIWNQYSQKMQKIQIEGNEYRNQTLERMIPQFRGIQEIQAFHLELFKSFKSSKLCKEYQTDQKSTPYQPSPSQIQQAPFPRPHNPIYMMDPNTKYMNLPSNSSGMIYSKVQEEPKFMNPVWSDRKYMEHPGSFPIPRMTEFQNMPLPSHQVPGIGNTQKYNFTENRSKQQQIENESLGSDSMDNYAENKSYLTGSEDQFFQKVQEYMFSQCACEGDHRENQKYMICKQCQFYFHFKCLNLDSNPNDQICPCCKLKQGSNIFVKIHPEPYGKRWCPNMKSQKLSILLTEKEIQRMKMKKKSVKPGSSAEYQLRFLKITKKPKNINGIKINSQNTRKFNSIPLPTNYIQKVQPFNVFQISLKSNDYNDEPQECTYFFAIFMIEKFSEVTLTQELFSNLNEQNSVGEEVLQKYLGDQQSITIKMRDPTSQQKILYPVRGDKCDHAGVFDYLSILQYYKEYGQKLKNKHCSFCSTQIGKMMVDKFLLDKINQFYQENPDKELEQLKYLGKGQVEYIMCQEEYSDIEDSNPEDSQPLSQ